MISRGKRHGGVLDSARRRREDGLLRRVVVLASTSVVASPEEFATAHRVARRLVERGIVVVTGGEALGPAGTVASAALAAGGRVVGVVLNGGLGDALQPDLTECRQARDPDDQRAIFQELADAWLALPHGLGSLEEIVRLCPTRAAREVPVGLLDEGRFFSGVLGRATDAALDRFIRESQRGAITLGRDLDDLLTRLADFQPPETRRANASASGE